MATTTTEAKYFDFADFKISWPLIHRRCPLLRRADIDISHVQNGRFIALREGEALVKDHNGERVVGQRGGLVSLGNPRQSSMSPFGLSVQPVSDTPLVVSAGVSKPKVFRGRCGPPAELRR
jgi:hypothetical protein